MNKTKIEWCDSTWNPVTGCLHGCPYCYARKIANRFGMPQYDNDCHVYTGKVKSYSDAVHTGPYPWGFAPTFHKYRLDEPARKTKGQNIFVCSMADLFGDWVPQEWIMEVWEACTKADWHNYLFLTKNPKRYKEIYRSELDYRCYMWLGTTATDSKSFAFKGQDLFNSTGKIEQRHAKRFISIEPLHEALNEKMLENNIKYLDWVIIGAETGNRKGKIIPKKEWIDSIVEQCRQANIPVFMKDSLIKIMGEENMLREFPEGLRRNYE
jgi:protein gp37